MKIQNTKFGCDAEVFLRTLDGNPIPVTGLVGGTKEQPKSVDEMILGFEKYEKGHERYGLTPDRFGFAVQEDNGALEFNIPASTDINRFSSDMDEMLRAVKHRILPRSIKPDMDTCSLEFSDKYLDSIPELHTFGCEPDLNAWSKMVNDRPVPPTPGFRSAAAHVHIGWDNPTDEDRIHLIRCADIFVVIPHMPYENKSAAARRRLYGKAGAFRYKPYGCEHRVLGNDWIKTDESRTRTLKNYKKAITAVNLDLKIDDDDVPRIQLAINEREEKLAVLLHSKYTKRMEKLMNSHQV